MEQIITYITLSFAAWLMGFLPMLEIYIALPASMLMGLDPLSCIFWTGLGNFMPIPIVYLFIDRLRKWTTANRFFVKIENNRFHQSLIKHGVWMILLATPIVGSWTIGFFAQSLGMSKRKLLVVSASSIGLYCIVLTLITQTGTSYLK